MLQTVCMPLLMVMTFLFWFCLAVLFYCYIGYGLLLMLINAIRGKRKNVSFPFYQPPVTLVIPAFNEAAVLPQKLQNAFNLSYPTHLLTILVVADGSDDETGEVLRGYPQVQVLHYSQRRGKAAALNHALQVVQTPIVIFTDADSLLNKDAVQRLVAHFATEKVGGVAGEKKIREGHSSVGKAEGIYWRYEAVMKRLDARLYTVLGAGELLAMRTALYPVLDEDLILDDLYLSMHIGLQGYTVAYEPRAYAVEAPTLSLHEEAKRKVRIAAGAFQAIEKLSLKKIVHYPEMAFQYLSRRWLRWVVCPLFIVAVLLLNVLLVAQNKNGVFPVLLLLQVLFYAAALVGWGLIRARKAVGWTTVPFYFLFMNFCMLKGLYLYLKGRHTALWQKAKKEVPFF